MRYAHNDLYNYSDDIDLYKHYIRSVIYARQNAIERNGNHRIKDIIESLSLALQFELMNWQDDTLVSINIAKIQTIRYVDIYEKRTITLKELEYENS